MTKAGRVRRRENHQWLEERIRLNDELSPPPRRPATRGEAEGYRTVGIIGGGTAGFFAALALRAQLPHLDVTLIESSKIPIIGVGEATVPGIIPFLHGTLGLDIEDFYEKVRPTWKQGIKFVWGQPAPYHFMAPFDWHQNSVGVLGSLEHRGDINSMTIQSMLMERDRTPIFRDGKGRYRSLLHRFQYAYHLDNVRLVNYLQQAAVRSSVKYLDRKIVNAVLSPDGEEVAYVETDGGERLSFDLYIDCSGFRSLLIGDKLRSPWMSYASSLFTDRALVFNAPHGGLIKPYTTAYTMQSGWSWIIPQVEEDHLGYVYSSAFMNEAQAEAEARQQFPGMGDPARVVAFRSGRHAEAWKGNVVAIGNAYAFVEPLESTGLLMITEAVKGLVATLPSSKKDSSARRLYNTYQGRLWDGLRWFLSIHYKFNRRLSTPFWRAVQEDTDISGTQMLLDIYREYGPLRMADPEIRSRVAQTGEIIFYGLQGFDCILLGQKVPTRLPKSIEPPGAWQERERRLSGILDDALPMQQALEIVREHPELLYQVMNDELGWVHNG